MIKFRAYLKIHERIIDVLQIDYRYNCIIWIDEHEYTKIEDFEDIELLQSTGLKDKNGVEIFEGDVIKVNNMKGLVKFGRYTDDEYIIYGLDGWLFSEIYHGRYIDIPLTEYVLDSDFEVEVIGDKYEHPHLLEE